MSSPMGPPRWRFDIADGARDNARMLMTNTVATPPLSRGAAARLTRTLNEALTWVAREMPRLRAIKGVWLLVPSPTLGEAPAPVALRVRFPSGRHVIECCPLSAALPKPVPVAPASVLAGLWAPRLSPSAAEALVRAADGEGGPIRDAIMEGLALRWAPADVAPSPGRYGCLRTAGPGQ